MEGIKQQFQWAVQALAQSADIQPTLFPSFVVVADELALEFDNWWWAFDSNFDDQLTQHQRQATLDLDHLLTMMSGPGKPELWLNEGCLRHTKWSEVRRLAAEVLSAFGWSLSIPPRERVMYTKCSAEEITQQNSEDTNQEHKRN